MLQEQRNAVGSDAMKSSLDYSSLDINSISLDQSTNLLANTILDLFDYVEFRNSMIEKQKKQSNQEQQQQDQIVEQDQVQDNSNEDLPDLTKLKSNESIDNSTLDVNAYETLVNNYKDITFKKVKLQQGYDFEDHLKDHESNAEEKEKEQEVHNNESRHNNDDDEFKVKFKIDETQNNNEEDNTELQKEEDERYTHEKINSLFKRFNLKKKPPISVHGYIKRLVKYLKASTTVIVTASFYIYKLIYFPHEKHPWKRNDSEIEEEEKEEDEADFHHLKLYLDLTELNVHRIILTAFRISGKLIEDMNYNSRYFCQIVGIDKKWLLKLETIMLFLLNFDLKVDANSLNNHFHKLKLLNDRFTSDQNSN